MHDDDDSDSGNDDEYDEDGTDYELNDEGLGSCDKSGEGNRPAALTDEQLLLCSATLKGYSLKNKKWRMFACLSRPETLC